MNPVLARFEHRRWHGEDLTWGPDSPGHSPCGCRLLHAESRGQDRTDSGGFRSVGSLQTEPAASERGPEELHTGRGRMWVSGGCGSPGSQALGLA